MVDFLRRMQEVQRKAQELQQGLASQETEGVAAGGLVRATMNGLGELKSLHIDPSLVKPDEVGVLQDLVVAACADGRQKLEARRFEDAGFLQELLKSFGQGPG